MRTSLQLFSGFVSGGFKFRLLAFLPLYSALCSTSVDAQHVRVFTGRSCAYHGGAGICSISPSRSTPLKHHKCTLRKAIMISGKRSPTPPQSNGWQFLTFFARKIKQLSWHFLKLPTPTYPHTKTANPTFTPTIPFLATVCQGLKSKNNNDIVGIQESLEKNDPHLLLLQRLVGGRVNVDKSSPPSPPMATRMVFPRPHLPYAPRSQVRHIKFRRGRTHGGSSNGGIHAIMLLFFNTTSYIN